MYNILAFICSNRVAAPCGMLVCPDCVGNIAGRANATSTTGFVYKNVKYLTGTLCGEEARKRGMSAEILAFHANRHALCAQVKKDLLEQGASGMQWKSPITAKVYNTPPERIASRHHPSHPSPDAFFPYSASNNAWFIHTKDNVDLVEQPSNYVKHIQLSVILWLLLRNLDVKEDRERLPQKITKPDPKAVAAHDALVVKNSNNMRENRHKSAHTQCNRLNKP
ncbi:hypothetical protein D6C80_02964 [Aureobasidium pullulans]|nr:hypothetical protein D6C80_02964 [Aureobasidium pullulans]